MQDYNDTFGNFPASAVKDPSQPGKPPMSWRVAILPCIEEEILFQRYNPNEPWDGPNNSRLLSQMPKVYASPGVDKDPPGYTHYRVFVGKNPQFAAALDPDPNNPMTGPRISAFADGTSNTILIVEADEATPWTKPDELPFDPSGPLPPLGGLRNGIVLVGLADGSVRSIDVKRTSPATLRAAITRSGGEVLGPDW
jgi:hypothetical protein